MKNIFLKLSFLSILFLFSQNLVKCSSNPTGIEPGSVNYQIALIPKSVSSNEDSLFVIDKSGKNKKFISQVHNIIQFIIDSDSKLIYTLERDDWNTQFIIYSVSIETTQKKKIFESSDNIECLELSSNGELLALQKLDHNSNLDQIFTLNTDGTGFTKISEMEKDCSHPSISSNADYFAFQIKDDSSTIPVFDDILVLGNRLNNSTTQILNSRNTYINNISFNPNGNSLAFICSQPNSEILSEVTLWSESIVSYSIETGKLDTLFSVSTDLTWGRLKNLHWSPDGTELAFISDIDSEYRMYHIYTIDIDGNNKHKITAEAGHIWLKAYDGEYFYYSGFNSELNISRVSKNSSSPEKITFYGDNYGSVMWEFNNTL